MILYLCFCLIAARIVDGIIPSSQYTKVIVIADMHGDAEALLMSLYAGYLEVTPAPRITFKDFSGRINHVIDTVSPPTEGPLRTTNDVAVVQMGDLVDRGKYSLRCLLIMRAIKLALGFEVFQVLGNHEIAPAINVNSLYKSYRNPKDDLDWSSSPLDIHRPYGRIFQEVYERFNPIVRLDGGPNNRNASTLFVHAGIPLDFLEEYIPPSVSLDDPNGLVVGINEIIKWMLASRETSSQKLLDDFFGSHDSIFTSRRYENVPTDCAEIYKVLKLFQVSRIIVGHMANMATNEVRKVYCPGVMEDRPVVILADVAASRFMYGFEKDDEEPNISPIVISLDTNGSLESVSAITMEPTSGVIASRKSLHIPVRGERSRLTEIATTDLVEMGPIIFADQFVSIRYAELNTMEGFILNITELNNPELVEALQYYNHHSSDNDDETSTIGTEFPPIYRIQVEGKEMIFSESSTAPMMLTQEAIDGNMKIVQMMEYFIQALHEVGLCIGLFVTENDTVDFDIHDLEVIRKRFMNYFVVSGEGVSLDFVNFSRLRICPGDEAAGEMENFVDAFHDELNPDEMDDE